MAQGGPDLFALIATVWSAVMAGQVPPEEVLKLLLSKALGYAVISGACITKLPQIQMLTRSRSAQGISFLSFELETLCLLIHASYGYVRGLPINTYGESIMLGIQMLILLALTYRYGNAPAARVMFVTSVLAGLAGWVLSGQVTQAQMQAAFSANTAIYMAARVPQIIKNFTSRSTGQLSLVTNSINVVGCLVRVFTTIQEKAGPEMLRQHIIATVLNATIVTQILIWGSKPASKPSPAARRAKEAAAEAAAEETKKAK